MSLSGKPWKHFLPSPLCDRPPLTPQRSAIRLSNCLLEDRFKAQVHTTTREVDGFVLTVARSGIKFKETSGDDQIVTGNPFLRGKYRMESIVKFLGFLIGPVAIIDKTGLTGLYDMTFMVDEIRGLSAENEGRGGPGGRQQAREFSPPVPKAVEEQLGLHMERAKVPVEVLVVDHLERATEN